jgi:hypothetical protein
MTWEGWEDVEYIDKGCGGRSWKLGEQSQVLGVDPLPGGLPVNFSVVLGLRPGALPPEPASLIALYTQFGVEQFALRLSDKELVVVYQAPEDDLNLIRFNISFLEDK